MDRNIIMAIVAVALVASVFIGISFFNKKASPCPTSDKVEIRTEQGSYDIGESVLLLVVVPNELPEISTYEWSVEGQIISKQPTTEFKFDKPGLQEVKVIINKGCSYTKIIEITDTTDIDYIEIEEGSISASKKKACPMEWIQFNDDTESASYWWWDFGDVNNAAHQNPRHRYKKPGFYTVKRTLNGEETLTSTITIEITKCRQAQKDTEVTANFNIKPIPAQVGQMVYFTDESPKAKSWLWNFGDGYTSTERNPSHVYNYSGNRAVTLSINGIGKNIVAKNITVFPALPPPPPAPRENDGQGKNTTAPPIVVVQSTENKEKDLATTLKTNFQKIADSKNNELKTNIYYDDLLPRIADENMPVKIKKNNHERSSKFFDYYNTLSIQGGQRIASVKVVSTDAEGRAVELLIVEQ